MGDVSKAINDILDINIWREFYDLNFFIPTVLNAVVMNTFNNKAIKKMVINITSLYGIEAGIGCGQYCSMKAAREMYFKVYVFFNILFLHPRNHEVNIIFFFNMLFVQVFALENPDIDVLNYAPGPVNTDMFTMACKKIADPKVKKMFNEMREKKTVLTTEQTINRLVQVLEEHKYNSADHVDYYDEL